MKTTKDKECQEGTTLQRKGMLSYLVRINGKTERLHADLLRKKAECPFLAVLLQGRKVVVRSIYYWDCCLSKRLANYEKIRADDPPTYV